MAVTENQTEMRKEDNFVDHMDFEIQPSERVVGEIQSQRNTEEPTFCICFSLPKGCCCGYLSLKIAVGLIPLIDITMGLASIGIIYIMI